MLFLINGFINLKKYFINPYKYICFLYLPHSSTNDFKAKLQKKVFQPKKTAKSYNFFVLITEMNSKYSCV